MLDSKGAVGAIIGVIALVLMITSAFRSNMK
jgi:hypothetical protein